MSSRSRRRKRERERLEREQAQSPLVVVEKNDWRTLYRVRTQASASVGGGFPFTKFADHGKRKHRKERERNTTPAPSVELYDSRITDKLREWSGIDGIIGALAAPLSDVDPAARKSDDGTESAPDDGNGPAWWMRLIGC